MAKKQTTPNRTTLEAAPYKLSAEDRKRQMKYEAEEAVRTLTRADEIKQDSRLMRAVKNHVKTMQKVCK